MTIPLADDSSSDAARFPITWKNLICLISKNYSTYVVNIDVKLAKTK